MVSSQATIDLTTLTLAQGFVIQGEDPGDRAGWSISSAGDVNGDGFDDIIIGAPFADSLIGESQAGRAYVIFGGASLTNLDLANLTPTQGFIISGDAAADTAGRAVSGAGDINGDGFADLIVGAPLGDDGGNRAGEASVIFGSAAPVNIDLSTLTPVQGITVQGDAAEDFAAWSVSSAGDVNGDGFDDLIIGAFRGDDGGYSAGESYVIFGSASPINIDLTTLTPVQGFVIQGDVAGDYAGRSVSSAGDVNGDGFDDIIVGAPSGSNGGGSAGEAYVILGSASPVNIDLTTLTPAQGFIIQGDVSLDNAGYSVSSAGDVNGDGFDDIIVGAPGGDNGGGNAGEAYVIFGRTAPVNIDLTTLTPAQGFIIQGDVADDSAGRSVSSAGDVNGDGFDDIIVGAPLTDYFGGPTPGSAYVVFGSASPGNIDLTTMTASQGFAILGDAVADKAGWSVSAAGDVNGDGFDDILVSAPLGDDGGTAAGEAYVILGGAFGLGSTPVTTMGTGAAEMLIGGLGNDILTGGGGADILRGGAGDDVLGVSSTDFADVDGGAGTDTLRLDGNGLSLNLATTLPAEITSIEKIDLTGSGNNSLTVDRLSILDLSEERVSGVAILTVNGNAGDVVNVADAGWFYQGSITVGGDSYERYTNGNAELRVENGVTANFARTIDLTTMSAAQGFIVQGDAAGDFAGWSVSSAGDVNGDGFDDLIVGALGGDNGGAEAGEAYVVFGGATPVNVDLTTMTAAQGFIIQGDVTNDQLGRSVSSAGDVNGDGFDDLIVGAPYGDNGGTSAGEAYVVFGGASPANVDLSVLTPAQGVIIQGDIAGDQVGWSVASAGDVNGDGFDDIIVGAKFGDDGGYNAGEAYVLFGGASSINVDLTNLTAAEGFVIQGDTYDDLAGFSVASAGDVNGDGFDDLIVGAPGGSNGGNFAGEAYVVFGSASPANIDLTTLTAAQGFIIQGDVPFDQAGFSVSSAGDVNGDGFDDLIVGAVSGDNGGSNAGEAYVVFGGATPVNIDLTTLTAAQGFVIQGDAAGDYAGWSVSSAGDVNGDGFDDLIVGARYGDDGGSSAGEAYVVFGSSSPVNIDLTTLNATQGFIIQGDVAGDRTGWSVSSVGDVNNDGFDDLIVGSPFGDNGGSNAGEAYVVLGGTFGLGSTPVTTTGTAGAEMLIGGLGNDALTGGGGADILRGGAGDDVLAVSSTGFADLDGGTGIDTLRLEGSGTALNLATTLPAEITSIELIDLTGSGNNSLTVDRLSVLDLSEERANGMAVLTVTGNAGDVVNVADAGWFYQGSITVSGESYERYTNGNAELRVEYGVIANFARTIDLTTLTAAQGMIIQGDTAGDIVGYSVSSAGDINGDGFDDLIVGAPNGDNGGTEAGEAYVVFGGAFPVNIDLTTLTAAQGIIIQGDVAGDQAGWSVSSAGDVNGDGFDDLIVGARAGDNGGAEAGEAYVVFGGASPVNIDLTTLTAMQGIIIQGDVAGDQAGFSVSSAGDINGDGFDDLILGAPNGDNGGFSAGEAYVVFGGTSPVNIDLTTLTAAQGIIIQGDASDDQAGRSVSSAGDVNGDGFDDLIVGAPNGDNGGSNAGEAYVVFGSASPANIDLTTLTAAQGFVIQGDVLVDLAGFSVCSAGDVNGDGLDDLIVGAPFGDDGGSNAGEAYVVFGSASPANIDLTTITAAQGFIIQGDVAGDEAGFSVSSAGDVNGDGFADLIVGAPFGDNGGLEAGGAYVVFGRAAPVNIDLSTMTAAQGFIVQGDAPSDLAGQSVSSAGDVNDDGFDDLIIGAGSGDNGGSSAGEAYVVLGGAFGRDSTPVTTTGTAAAEILIGGLGNDTLTSGGGADILRGGAGNDVLGVSGTGFADIDGGAGIDTLRLDGSGDMFDFSVILPAKVTSIEMIDLAGTGNNNLVLGARDLFDLSDDTLGGFTRLTVHGDAGDSVSTLETGWTNVGTTTIDDDTFTIFENGQAQLIVDTDINIAGVLP
ncbi:hypothetical protein [Aminobacter aminovorans]|uniref:hypothetical protein n=1 Tax=Aminobacter TaxID=31988 RepID=UPI00286C461C|nr:hypothetical protein [Aminobacter aminovorans]